MFKVSKRTWYDSVFMLLICSRNWIVHAKNPYMLFLFEDEIVHVKNLFSWFYFMFDARNCSRHEIYSWFYLCCRRQTVHTNNPFIFFMFKVSERTWYDPVFMLFQVQGMESFIPRIHSCFFMFKVGIRPC
jgi:hypothetical protein